jgi:hypothetical protein
MVCFVRLDWSQKSVSIDAELNDDATPCVEQMMMDDGRVGDRHSSFGVGIWLRDLFGES